MCPNCWRVALNCLASAVISLQYPLPDPPTLLDLSPCRGFTQLIVHAAPQARVNHQAKTFISIRIKHLCTHSIADGRPLLVVCIASSWKINFNSSLFHPTREASNLENRRHGSISAARAFAFHPRADVVVVAERTGHFMYVRFLAIDVVKHSRGTGTFA